MINRLDHASQQDKIQSASEGTMRQLLGFASVIAMLVAPINAGAVTFAVQGDTLKISGVISKGDSAGLSELLTGSDAQGVTTIVLNSVGGLVVEGIGMAQTIKVHQFITVVPEAGICASACFLLFAAGDLKAIGHGARIGVHSATSTRGVGPDDGNGTLLMARYAAQIGVPPAIVGRMVVTDSVNMTWLNADYLQQMNIIELDSEGGSLRDNPRTIEIAQKPIPLQSATVEPKNLSGGESNRTVEVPQPMKLLGATPDASPLSYSWSMNGNNGHHEEPIDEMEQKQHQTGEIVPIQRAMDAPPKPRPHLTLDDLAKLMD